MSGAMRDKQGNELREAARYKKFAGMTVLLFAIILGVVILLSGLSIIYAVTQLVTQLQNGDGLQNLIPGLGGATTQQGDIDKLLQGL
jgi:predicted PurR-regulated permease PerM